MHLPPQVLISGQSPRLSALWQQCAEASPWVKITPKGLVIDWESAYQMIPGLSTSGPGERALLSSVLNRLDWPNLAGETKSIKPKLAKVTGGALPWSDSFARTIPKIQHCLDELEGSAPTFLRLVAHQPKAKHFERCFSEVKLLLGSIMQINNLEICLSVKFENQHLKLFRGQPLDPLIGGKLKSGSPIPKRLQTIRDMQAKALELLMQADESETFMNREFFDLMGACCQKSLELVTTQASSNSQNQNTLLLKGMSIELALCMSGVGFNVQVDLAQLQTQVKELCLLADDLQDLSHRTSLKPLIQALSAAVQELCLEFNRSFAQTMENYKLDKIPERLIYMLSETPVLALFLGGFGRIYPHTPSHTYTLGLAPTVFMGALVKNLMGSRKRWPSVH